MLYRGALVPRRELSAGPAPRKTVQLIQKFRGDRKSVQSKTAEDPSRASFGDRDDLTGLSRGRRSFALDRASHRRRSLSNHGGGGLENGRGRRLDRSILALVCLPARRTDGSIIR